MRDGNVSVTKNDFSNTLWLSKIKLWRQQEDCNSQYFVKWISVSNKNTDQQEYPIFKLETYTKNSRYNFFDNRAVLRDYGKVTAKHLLVSVSKWSSRLFPRNFIEKETPAQLLSQRYFSKVFTKHGSTQLAQRRCDNVATTLSIGFLGLFITDNSDFFSATEM